MITKYKIGSKLLLDAYLTSAILGIDPGPSSACLICDSNQYTHQLDTASTSTCTTVSIATKQWKIYMELTPVAHEDTSFAHDDRVDVVQGTESLLILFILI